MRQLTLLVALSISLSLYAGNRKDVPTDFPLPSDFSVDFQLASSQRSHLNISTVTGTEMNVVSNKVFGELVGTTMIVGYGLPYHWQLAVTNDQNINAGSLPDGEVVVYGGLASMLGKDPGLWAAVLSHEVAHTARRHAVREYQYRLYVAQQEAYWRARALAGDKSANWALLGLTVSAKIGEKKLSRDLEHDADITGMMLMARAGYHPDNVFALHHLIRLHTGDQSKFAAFFSTHPRWETRDQRDDKAYADALAEYSRLWPDPARSPGGSAPAVVFLGKPQSLEEKQMSAARISIPMYCRNESDAVTVTLLFQKDGQPIPTPDQTVRNNKGELQIQDAYKCGERSEAAPFEVSLNSAAVPKEDHKLKARALVSVNGNLLEESQEFEVHVPKGATGSRDVNPLSSPSQSGTPSRAQAQPRSLNTMALASAPASSPAVSAQQSPETQHVPSAMAVATPVSTDVQIEFSSTPGGASIELDGKFVGKTPTTITVSLGEHRILIRKPEFGVWQKTLDVTPADRRIAAYLEQRTLNLQ